MSTGKLATIVVVDVSGFSARAQADERAAVAAVARLIKRCGKVAKAHGGRVFNTAGDAVMMEFPSVSAGLEAADDLAKNPDPPIRIGVHLGEVRQMPHGDLLGQGVNVATQLQALAAPGGVVVSEDARRALRGPLSDRLVSPRSVKLDKIPEAINVYDLTRDAEAVARAQAALRTVQAARRTAVVGMAALGAALAIALAWPVLQPPPPARVAVFSLEAPADDASLRQLAGGVAEDITSALSAVGVQTVARAETAHTARAQQLELARILNASLALDGAVERNGDVIRLTISIARSRDRATVWSGAFEGTVAETRVVRQRAAQRSADVLACGVKALRRQRSALDAETLTLFLHSCETLRDRPLETRDTLLRVLEREPNFPFARGRAALAAVVASEDTAGRLHDALRRAARADAQRALREDRDIGESYLALELLETPTNWAARENLLQAALTRDELNATVNNFYADLLQEVGRTSEALAFAQHGAALDPLSTSRRRSLAYLLLMNGQNDEARDLVEGMAYAWSGDAALWQARFKVALWSGRYDDAAALLDAPASTARTGAARTCWRDAISAVRAAQPSPQGARAALDCHRAGAIADDQIILLLAALGDADDAFQLIRSAPARYAGPLFYPQAAPLRADARFMPLMRDLRLLRYWRLSAHWPDFCRAPGLPYRCETEAQRLT